MLRCTEAFCGNNCNCLFGEHTSGSRATLYALPREQGEDIFSLRWWVGLSFESKNKKLVRESNSGCMCSQLYRGMLYR